LDDTTDAAADGRALDRRSASCLTARHHAGRLRSRVDRLDRDQEIEALDNLIPLEHHDLEQVRALLGHTRVDTTQISVQLKRAVVFYEDKSSRMLGG
jgi:hypothetical protein